MDKWTGVLIGNMHNEHVTYEELAKELGVGKPYVSMVLCCKRKPSNAEERFNEAFKRILARRDETHDD